jgi:two-component system OmpR family response regulator
MAKRVLVVDDEPSIRQLFELVLGEAGYEVVTAGDGAAAVARAREQPVDVVFLDIQLPDAHGSEVFAQLKELRPPPVVCVLTAMTASDHDRLDDYVRLIRLGAEDLLLRKPLYKEDILKVTRKLLGDPT